jgi:hypothetical protein
VLRAPRAFAAELRAPRPFSLGTIRVDDRAAVEGRMAEIGTSTLPWELLRELRGYESYGEGAAEMIEMTRGLIAKIRGG